MTVKELKTILENVPDNLKVLVYRSRKKGIPNFDTPAIEFTKMVKTGLFEDDDTIFLIGPKFPEIKINYLPKKKTAS